MGREKHNIEFYYIHDKVVNNRRLKETISYRENGVYFVSEQNGGNIPLYLRNYSYSTLLETVKNL